MRSFWLRLGLIVTALFSFYWVEAQTYAETALIFGRTAPSGSARVQSLGGSQTAIGGDYSSAISNPAGLGMYNRGEFTFSLGFNDNKSTSSYFDSRDEDSRAVFNVPGFSYIWHFPNRDEGFIGGSLAFSFSRVNDFNRQAIYSGSNGNKSIIDYFIEQSNGFTTDQFMEGGYHYNSPTGLGYHNYLIGPLSAENPNAPDDIYFTYAPLPEDQTEMEEILVKGAANQWSFSYGGNVNDKFFFGAGLGVTSLRYESRKDYTEMYDADTLSVQMMHLTEKLSIRGTGVNATLGVIVRPVNSFQIGVSYTTPTVYGLSETWEAAMGTRWDPEFIYPSPDGGVRLGDNLNDPITSDIITSDYRLTVPSKLRGGVTYITPFGFITGDVEYTNPSKLRYKSNIGGLSFEEDNDEIREIYRPIVNYRIGAEFRRNIWRVRAGYNLLTNAFDERLNADNSVSSITGGVGIRTKTFYVDLGVIHGKSQPYPYRPYAFADGSGPVAEFTDRTLRGVLTVGFTF